MRGKSAGLSETGNPKNFATWTFAFLNVQYFKNHSKGTKKAGLLVKDISRLPVSQHIFLWP